MRFASGTPMFPVVAVLLILSLLPMPVLAQGGPTINVEPQTVSTYVGSTFSVEVWIRRVPSEGLALIEFKVVWDPGLLQLVNYGNHVAQNSPHWEIKSEEQVSASYLLEAQDPTISLYPANLYALHDDMSWVTLTFRCTGEGDVTIDFPITEAPNRWGYWSDGSDGYSFDEYLSANVRQTEPITPVGGFIEPVNKLAVFAPYLALFGVIATVAVVVWKKPSHLKSKTIIKPYSNNSNRLLIRHMNQVTAFQTFIAAEVISRKLRHSKQSRMSTRAYQSS